MSSGKLAPKAMISVTGRPSFAGVLTFQVHMVPKVDTYWACSLSLYKIDCRTTPRLKPQSPCVPDGWRLGVVTAVVTVLLPRFLPCGLMHQILWARILHQLPHSREFSESGKRLAAA